MKNDYFSDEQTDLDSRRKQKKSKANAGRFFKGLLIAAGILVLLLAASWAVLRFVFSDFYFSNIIENERAAVFLDEKVMGRTAAEEPETVSVTEPVTVYESMTYLDSDNFDFSSEDKGNFIGNIMNGGKACYSGGYAYHIIDGEGIYRFAPSSESYALVFSTEHNISSLNVFGDSYYFVDENDNTFCKAQRNGSVTKLTDNVLSAYVYDGYAYCVSSFNQIMKADVSTGDASIIFSAKDNQELSFVGLAQDRVFFTLKENNKIYYLTVDMSKTPLTAESFMKPSDNDRIKYMTMENGYMYYCVRQNDSSYNLVRQKFGSDSVVTLAENESIASFVSVDSNKVFYSCLKNGNIYYKEYNMNSGECKIMLKSGADEKNVPSCYHCGEYDFIIGGGVYIGSSNLTSSSRVMTFSNGYWKY